jgi:hypothetical protein
MFWVEGLAEVDHNDVFFQELHWGRETGGING